MLRLFKIITFSFLCGYASISSVNAQTSEVILAKKVIGYVNTKLTDALIEDMRKDSSDLVCLISAGLDLNPVCLRRSRCNKIRHSYRSLAKALKSNDANKIRRTARAYYKKYRGTSKNMRKCFNSMARITKSMYIARDHAWNIINIK